MKLNDLESYYFCTPEIDRLREKYYPTFRELLGVENFFNNKKLNSDEHWDKLSEMACELIKYVFSDEKIKDEFVSAYRTDDDYVIGEILIQSVVADIAIKMKLKFNIFKDKRSILYFDNTYPKNILIYKNKEKSGNLFEYIAFFEDFKETLRSIPPEEIFGEEFIEEMEQLVKEFKDKQVPDKKKRQ